MKVSKRDILLLTAFLGVLVAVCSYLFVYQKNIEKATQIETENASLSSELAKLQKLNEYKEDYIQSTEDMKVWMSDFESQFPVDIKTEDSIMMVKNMEDSTRTFVASVAFGGIAEVPYVATVQTDTATPVASNGPVEVETTVYPDTRMFEAPLSISIDCTYDDFKGLVRYIYGQQERMCIKGVNIGYNEESGKLSGNMTMGTYYLEGTDKLYVEPDIPSMGMGIDTIFGNVD